MIKKESNRIIFITIITLCVLLIMLLVGKNIKTSYEIESINNKIETVTEKEDFEIWVIDGGLSYILDDVVEEYRTKYPNIRFIIKSFSERVYYKTILSAAATNSLPDMFYSWGDTELEELVKLGIIEDITLTVEARKLKESMNEGALDGYTIDNRVYGVPVFGWDLVMYCNKELFQKAGAEYPSNYEDLMIAINKFKEHEIIPLTISGKDAWTQSMYYMAFALEDGSISENVKIKESPGVFEDYQFRKAALKLENISKVAPWLENYENMSAGESGNAFTYGYCGMLLSGSWVAANIDCDLFSLKSEDIEVVKFPDIENIGIGGYCDGFVLSKSDKYNNFNELLYIELVKDISDYAILKRGMGIPVYKNKEIDNVKYSTVKKCQDLFSDQRHSAYDRILPAKRKDIYNNALRELVVGDIDADKFIETITRE